jgi:hypothetical protein
VAENISDSTVIAAVKATEDDATGEVSYSITGGNNEGLFEIDASTGEVSLADGKSLDANVPVHTLTVAASESDGLATATATVTIDVTEVGDAPGVVSVDVNGGEIQRSMVTEVVVTFDTPVTVGDSGAYELMLRGNSIPVPVTGVLSPDGLELVFTFDVGYLLDGVYDLTLRKEGIKDASTVREMATDYLFTFHQLYGDADGDKDVDGADLSMFRTTYGALAGDSNYLWYFDYDKDGDVDGADYTEFRANYRKKLEY